MIKGFPVGTVVKNPPANTRDARDSVSVSWVRKISLEEGIATHCSILAWRIPWTEKLGRLWSIEPQRAQRHN